MTFSQKYANFGLTTSERCDAIRSMIKLFYELSNATGVAVSLKTKEQAADYFDRVMVILSKRTKSPTT